MTTRPITICGGGIAGLSLGVALAKRNLKVRLFEAGHYPRHRVCGEFISGASSKTLATLGITDLLADAERNWSTAWWDKRGVILQKKLPDPALGVSRFRLDQRLAEKFTEHGGELHEGTRLAEDELSERGTIYAMGRPKVRDNTWLGLKCHLFDYPLAADLEMHLGDGGYLGMSKIEEQKVNACGLFRLQKQISVKKETALANYLEAVGLESLAQGIRRSQVDESSQLGVSAFLLGNQNQGKTKRFRIGDQNAIIGPFTGNGMSMALESAALAVPYLEEYAHGIIEWERALDRFQVSASRKFERRIRTSNWVHPFLTKPSLQSALTAMGRASLLPFGLLYRLTR